jgi:hypothetical protein
MTAATYVYCIVRRASRPGLATAPGGLPDAGPPAALPLAPALWLVTAPVPLEVYGPGVLEASLRDIDWVSRAAVAHDAVVEHCTRARGASVIPMKLFTMFSTPGRAAAAMRRRQRELARVFEHIEGCEEWGVRVQRGAGRARGRQPARPATGAAFLAARKQARDESKAAMAAVAAVADTAFTSLSGIARDRRRSGEAAGAAPLLDAAFLVPARRRARFRAAAERLARDVAKTGGQMTLTGPWPPYNFVAAKDAT